jgi:replicative DNA helicase
MVWMPVKQQSKKDPELVPSSVDSEEAVIGSLLIDDELIFEIRSILKPEDFWADKNRWIYESCIGISNRGEVVNQITVAQELHNKGHLQEIGGAAFLSTIISQTPSSVMAESYARVVKNTSIARQTMKLGKSIYDIGKNETDTRVMVAKIEEGFLELQKEISVPKLLTSKHLAELGNERYNTLNQGEGKSIKTGFKDFDYQTGGLFGGEYWLVAARAGLGKTELMLDIARNVGKRGNKVLVCSIEQSWAEILDRMMGSYTEKSPRLIRFGKYSQDLFDSIIYHLADVAESNLYFYDSGGSNIPENITVSKIFSIANHMKLSYGLDMIVVDYIGLIDDEYGKSQNDRITYISRKLKLMARNLDVPLVCACQLNRRVEHSEDRRPTLSDLRDSGSLEQDADGVIFLYRDDYYEDIREKILKEEGRDCSGSAELILAKQRQGGGREITFPLHWDNAKRCYMDGY